MFRSAIPIGMLLGLIVPAAAFAQDKCTAIHFAAGASSATITDVSHGDQIVCYTFAAAAAQTADLRVTGSNMMISVYDVGDARDAWNFKTKARTYKFIVAQMLRPFRPLDGVLQYA
jgi:hypothetical protein